MCPSRVISLSFFVLVAAFLQFEHITQPLTDVVNFREASTAVMAQNFFRGNWNIFYPEVSWNGPDPGYQGREFQLVTYTAALLYKFTGPADWVGRAISAVAGVWGVVALFGLMNITVGWRPALFGAAILSVLPGAIFLERSFLPDGTMSALATTSLWLWTLLCRSGRRVFLYSSVTVFSVACLVKLQALTVIGPAIYLYSFSGLRDNQAAGATAPTKYELGALALFSVTVVVAYYLWAKHLADTYPPHIYAGRGKFIF